MGGDKKDDCPELSRVGTKKNDEYITQLPRLKTHTVYLSSGHGGGLL